VNNTPTPLEGEGRVGGKDKRGEKGSQI